MPAASAPDVFGYHEQRLNDIEDDLKKVTSDQASVGTKLDALVEQVQETKVEISGKLDRLLEIGSKVGTLEIKVESLEKSRSVIKSLALKAALPAGLVLVGLLTGAEGASIWKFVAKLLGGE